MLATTTKLINNIKHYLNILLQRLLTKHARTGIEKCRVCTTFNTSPCCFPGKFYDKLLTKIDQ